MPPPPPLPGRPGVEIESTRTVWEGRFPLQIVRFRQRRFDGKLSDWHDWELLRRGRAACLLPYDPVADAVLLIDQFRLPALAAGLDPLMVEIPAGLCDPGESPEQTMLREAGEEIGITPDAVLPVGDFLLSPGASDERVWIFAGCIRMPASDADGVIGHNGLAHENEDLRLRAWPAKAAIDAVLAGEIHNAVTAIALLWLAARREALRRDWRDQP
jgi:ADP-ribose pyrophosphatase